MKKLLSLLAILMVALTTWADDITAEEPTTGDGSSSSPYEIATPGNLVWFANQVNSGNTSICGKLTADVNLGDDQTMIGIGYSNCFTGTFDGDGHTITFNYIATEDYAGLFSYAQGVTIKNLRTAGSITTAYKRAGGIIGICTGTVNITNCQSSVTIQSTVTSATECNHGGIIGFSCNTTTLTNVLFDGELLGENATACGGLIGYGAWLDHINNCLFYPKNVTFSSTGAKTFANNTHPDTDLPTYGADVKFSYYSTAFGTEQGTYASSEDLTSGKTCFELNQEESSTENAWRQTLGTDVAPVLDSSHGIVYAGEDLCPQGKYSNSSKSHTYGDYADGGRTCSVCGYIDCQEPTYDSETNAYLLGSKYNLIWFARAVNNGNNKINGKLTADIDLGDDQTMIGSANNAFEGNFDGDGHTVTVNYTATGDYAALFQYVCYTSNESNNISNLHVAGKITSGYKYASGIVGCSTALYLKMFNCSSSVTIQNTFTEEKPAYNAGIVAKAQVCYILNNVFNGKLLGQNATNCSGFIAEKSLGATVLGCLFNPSEVTVSSTNASTFGCSYTYNSYYTKALGTEEQGTLATADMLASGEVCCNLNTTWKTFYQNIDNGETPDPVPVQDSTHGTVYYYSDYGTNPCVSARYTNSNIHYSHIATEEFNEEGEKVCTRCNLVLEYQPATYDEATGEYIITNRGNLGWFAQQVDGGNVSINARLENDIDLTVNTFMIGSSDNKYAGTFNGNNHTVTVKYTAAGYYAALFRYVNGATIKDLKTAGNISTDKQYAAGIVACTNGATTINGCQSSVVITSTATSEFHGFHGGIVADNEGTLTLSNSLFNGQLLGQYATNCGGLVGKNNSSATLTGCWFNPSAEVTFGTTGSATLSRGNDATIEGCYYSATLGTEQGTPTTAETLASGEVCYNLNIQNTDGTQCWYQNIDNGNTVDAYPVLDNTHGTVYYGDNICSSALYGNIINHTSEGYDEQGEMYCTLCHKLFQYQPATYSEASNQYVISNRGNLIWFANQVKGGNVDFNGLLAKDISLGDNQTMIGTYNNRYKGTFDGNIHSITVNYTATADTTALFRYVNGATIKNLKVSGNITTGHKLAAGIIGYCEGISTLSSCQCSVAITSTYTEKTAGEHGGIVAKNAGNLTVNNVLFDGKMIGEYTISCGGMVGYTSGHTTFNNCFFNASVLDLDTNIGCDSYTMSRGDNKTINNCYAGAVLYHGDDGLKDAQYHYEIKASGKLCCALNDSITDGTQAWYQNITEGDVDAYPVPFNTHGTVYCGADAHPNTLAYSNQAHPWVNVNGYMTDEVCGLSKFEEPEYDAATDTYYIKNMGNLMCFADSVSAGNKVLNAKLTADIDLSGSSFIGLGDGTTPFMGVFDGQGYRIKNWTVTYSGGNGHGFFRAAAGENTTIKNLIIDSSCSITSNGEYSGTAGLIGFVKSTSGSTCNVTILNCGNEATITGYDNVSGILGGVYDNTSTNLTITNSYNTGAIKGSTKSATLCAIANCNHTFTNCYNSGSLTGVKDKNYFYRTEKGTSTVSNCYDVNGSQTGVTLTTANQVTSGELCNLLNNNDIVFAQNVASEDHPIPGTEGLTGITETHITTADELLAFATAVNSANGNILFKAYLDNDIDMSGKDFPVIGKDAKSPFIGIFDGQGHRIKNMTLSFAEGGVGLIGCASGTSTVIKNVIIDSSCSVTSTSGAGVAGLLGQVKPFNGIAASVAIENCGNEAAITGTQNVAGILGGVYEDDDNSVIIRYCYNTGSITNKGSDDNSATICGYARTNYRILNCYNSGKLSGDDGENKLYNYKTATKIGVVYCYDVNGSQTGVTLVTPEQIVSGEVCYLLNTYGGGDQVNNVFSQNVTTQTYPVPGTDGLTGIAETHITTANELISFACDVNAANGSKLYDVYLDNDITLEIKTGEPSFPIIGYYETSPFKGSFNGQGHRIKNMKLSSGQGYTGFFGFVAGANTTIKNTIIDSSCSVTSTATSGYGTAGLIGCVSSTNGTPCNVTILNCGNEAPVTGGINTAGLLGGVYKNDNAKTLIYNSYNSGAISGSKESATICGYIRKNYGVMNCFNSGTLTGGDGSQATYRTGSGGQIYFSKDSYDVNGDQGDFMQKVTADDVRLGKLCQTLNTNRADESEWAAWTQDLENNVNPVFGDAGIHYTRTMKNQWGTICLPFDAEMGDEYDFYELSDVNNDYLILTKVTTLAAGTPAVLRRNTAATGVDIPAVGTTTVTTPITGSSANGLTLTGSFTSMDITDNDGYIISNNAFWNISSIKSDYSSGAAVSYKVYCDPFRAYLAGSIPSGAKMLTIDIDDETTAVDALNAITEGDAEYYDLSGHKLNNLQKGINIVKFSNGVTKKIIIK